MKRNFARRMLRATAAIVLLSATLFVSPAALSASQPAGPEESGCSYIIPSDVDTVDGTENYAQVVPGDVLCLPSGTRGNLKLVNLNGSPGNPITVRNSGGNVVITGEKFLIGGIGVIGSSNLRITGTGVGSQCGAPFPAEEQNCGIQLDHTFKGIKLDTTEGQVENIEVDHVSVSYTSQITETRGIAIHPLPGQLISGISIHHNYVAHTDAEGIYVGTEPHGEPFDTLAKVENVEVSYNLVEEIGFDGIKIKVAINNVKVHHNIVRNAALGHVENHEAGIQMALSVGDYFNNFVSSWCEGIAMGRTLDSPGTRYFNNVVVGAQCGGITAPEDGALVFNNTVIGSEPTGISAKGKDAQVFDNIVAGTLGIPIEGREQNIFNNWIGPVSSAGFVNPAAGDYHLLPSSPAIGAGRNTGMFPAFDLDEVSRPVGARTDLGAYEYPLSFNSYLPLLFNLNQP